MNKMAKNNKMPAIRFSGYTDTWEQRKLNDVFQIIDGDRGKNYPGTGDFLSNGDVLFLDTGNVRKDGFNFDNKRYIDVNRDKLLHNGRLILGDYVLTSRGTLGNLAYYSQSIYNRYPQIRINSAMLILRVMNTIKVNNLYLYITLRSNVINEFMKHNFVGSAQPHITKKEFSSVLLPIPRQLEEQKIIGDFFDKLEKIITLHQRKLEKLKLTKKALLQKLFPQNGSKFPELRFKGFTAAWEQRKLGQFTARVTRKNGGQSDLPLTISAQDGLVDQRKYFNRQVASRDMSNYYLIKKGEFAYNKSYSEGYPFGAVKRLDYYNIGALSTLYILFEITDKNISSDFIVSYYMTHLWYKEISKRAAEGARNHGLLNISTEDFFDSELNIPNSIEEQVKIGNFIKEFDKFITLHQRKLEMLKNVKKGLLQKMFV